MWGNILPLFGDDGVSPKLELRCQNHPKTSTLVATADDFKNVRDGGCNLSCNVRLDCGHSCSRQCHPGGHTLPCHKKCGK